MGTVEDAVQFALAQVGKPYVWGKTGPNAFDCSGLVFASYRHAGFKVSRVTYTQIFDGARVGQSEMERGDLWFTDPGHVAIYLGNGMMVEAPNSRSRVRVVPVRRFFAGRRIGQPSGVDSSSSAGSTVSVGFIPGVDDLTEAVGLLTNRHTWLRIGTVMAGMVLIGLIFWGVVGKGAAKVVKEVT